MGGELEEGHWSSDSFPVSVCVLVTVYQFVNCFCMIKFNRMFICAK